MSGAKLLLLGAVQQAVASDPYFENTTLLLPGNGTNGAQNNTFLDSSTNAFSITRNGNTTQGTFSPFSQTGWGVYFNGSSDYISVADSADFTMGSGDFTVQCWVYSTANSGSDQYILGQVNSGGTAAATSFQLYKKATSNVAEAFVYAGGSKVATGTAQIPVGQWTHLAMVRDGGTLRLYVNGSQDGTNATLSTTAITDSAGSFSVGRTGDYNGLYFAGYVSNVSVVKGTCLFPSGTTFTPSATPLSTSTSGQSVLLCQANRFIDTNTATTAKTVTVGSTSSIQAFSPFNPTAAWSAATNGGSGYFDGSGDYLVTPSNAALSNTLLASDFTIETWLYLTAAPSGGAAIWTNSVSNSDGFSSSYVTSNLAIGTGKVGVNEFATANNVLALHQWNHFACVRNGATVYIYVNGTQVASGAASTYLNTSATKPMTFGSSYQTSPAAISGYFSNIRVVSSAVYTSAFTPPTAPLTAITNTQLLINFTNAGIYDATSKNDLETVGNAQISTTQSKFGGSSMYFDGTDDRLVAPSTINIAIGTADFTIEGWFYTASPATNRGLFQISTTAGGLEAGNTNNLAVYCSSSVLGVYYASTFKAGTTSISANTWTHFALVRTGGSTKLYVNGTADSGFGTNADTQNYTGKNVCVGGYFSTTYLWSGYIQDFRVTRGVARYTANFTAPTAAFPLL